MISCLNQEKRLFKPYFFLLTNTIKEIINPATKTLRIITAVLSISKFESAVSLFTASPVMLASVISCVSS